MCDSHHCQVTMSGKTESYNELHKNSPASQFCREFSGKNAKNLDFLQGDCEEEEDEEEQDDVNTCPQFRKTFFWEASRKSLSSAVWLYLTILEAMENENLEDIEFGPKLVDGKRINLKESLKQFMRETDDKRWDILEQWSSFVRWF